ncbi:hypothetical protein ACFY12_03420 [Streptomyces sp. NPDC001339]|uniref:hypothetical protein n=1 Tax=Streptomyces sp. NPDC001339 TaxID=3364563 RepID=UPI00369D2600
MTHLTHFMELVQPEAGTALISEWRTGASELSRAAADAMIGELEAAETPSALLAQHLFLSTDGTSLLFYAQWTSDEDHLVWARAHRNARVSRIDAIVPGIERPGLNRTRLHRSVVHDADRRPGVFVVTTMATDEAEGAVRPTPGLLAGHIHLTTDGERAIVVTEWTDAASHEAAVTTASGTSGTGHQQYKRYTLHHSFLGCGAKVASETDAVDRRGM